MKKNKNIFQQKGFYFALYSVVVGIAILVSVVTYSNLYSLSPKQTQIAKSNQDELTKPVLNNQSKSYLAPEDRNEKESVPTSPQNKSLDSSKNKSIFETASPSPSLMPTPTDIDDSKQTPTENNQDNNEDNTQSFNSFDDNQKMEWPVFGEIVMDYDNENLVYDKTLEQYRTNDGISLSAQVGDQVKATADGIVKLITNTPESGNTIVIDHGNDWTTTYSQLQDDLLVNEGDIVKKGQVIGGVNTPTKYGILLGSHLDFKIAHEDNYVDPKLIMVER